MFFQRVKKGIYWKYWGKYGEHKLGPEKLRNIGNTENPGKIRDIATL
jgi:heterodisulfide reductase subunit B